MSRAVRSSSSAGAALAGRGVVAIGLYHDLTSVACEAFARAGASVLAYDVSSDEAMFDDDEWELRERMLVTERVKHLENIGRARVLQVLSDDERDGWGELWNDAIDALGGSPAVIYLGPWWGVTDYEIGKAALRAAVSGDVEQVVTAYTGHDRYQTMLRWADELGASERLVHLREPTFGPGPPDVGAALAAVDVLRAAGWSSPVTRAEVDVIVDRLRTTGADHLAGEAWRFECSVWLGRGTLIIADAVELPLPWEPPERWWESLREGEVGWLKDVPTPVLFVHAPEQDVAADLDVTPEAGRAHAVRLGFDADAFIGDGRYRQVEVFELRSGRLAIDDIGSPARYHRRVEVDAVPGRWAVELTANWESGVRLRLLSE